MSQPVDSSALPELERMLSLPPPYVPHQRRRELYAGAVAPPRLPHTGRTYVRLTSGARDCLADQNLQRELDADVAAAQSTLPHPPLPRFAVPIPGIASSRGVPATSGRILLTLANGAEVVAELKSHAAQRAGSVVGSESGVASSSVRYGGGVAGPSPLSDGGMAASLLHSTPLDRIITKYELHRAQHLAAPHLSAARFLSRTKHHVYSTHYPLVKHGYVDETVANGKRKPLPPVEKWYWAMGLSPPPPAGNPTTPTSPGDTERFQ